MIQIDAAFLGPAILATVALLVFVLGQTVTPRLAKRRNRLGSFADLITELEQNKRHQDRSTFVSLEDGAYKRFRSLGFLSEQDRILQDKLKLLYSLIHEKNELIDYYRLALAGTGQIVSVTGGETPVPITNVISAVRHEIDTLMDTTLSLLIATYSKARDP